MDNRKQPHVPRPSKSNQTTRLVDEDRMVNTDPLSRVPSPQPVEIAESQPEQQNLGSRLVRADRSARNGRPWKKWTQDELNELFEVMRIDFYKTVNPQAVLDSVGEAFARGFLMRVNLEIPQMGSDGNERWASIAHTAARFPNGKASDGVVLKRWDASRAVDDLDAEAWYFSTPGGRIRDIQFVMDGVRVTYRFEELQPDIHYQVVIPWKNGYPPSGILDNLPEIIVD